MKFDKEKLIEKLKQSKYYSKHEYCIYCGIKMKVNHGLYLLVSTEISKYFPEKVEALPVISLICPGCGHIDLLDALHFGIAEKDEEHRLVIKLPEEK